MQVINSSFLRLAFVVLLSLLCDSNYAQSNDCVPQIVMQSEYDAKFAHKSFVVKHNGIVYHFYNAVNKKDQRGIAVATSKEVGKSNMVFNTNNK